MAREPDTDNIALSELQLDVIRVLWRGEADVAAVMAWLCPVGFCELAWRCLLVAAGLSLLTWKAVDIL
jgi:hypothetical protein